MLEAEINKTKLDSYRVSPFALYNAISQNNKAIPAGKIVSSTGEFYVSVPSVFETMEDVGNIPVIENNNAVVSLEDLVKLKRTFKDKSSAIPFAIFAIKLAVHGVTKIASEFVANLM